MLKAEGVPMSTVVQEMFEWICGEIDMDNTHWLDITLLGQNAQFDRGFLEQAFKDNVPEYKKWPFDYHVLSNDTLFFNYIYKRDKKPPWSMTQKNICKELGITPGTAHDARADVEDTVKVFRKLING